MDTDSGRLFDPSKFTEQELVRILGSGKFVKLPADLEEAAKRKLNGKREATVSLTSGGKLSRFASQDRAKKRKQRRKIAKASRKRNRR